MTMSSITFLLLVVVSAVCILVTSARKLELGDKLPVGLSSNLDTAVSSLLSKSPQTRAKRYASEDCREIINLAAKGWLDCHAISLRYYSAACRRMRLSVYRGFAACIDEATGTDLDNIATLYAGWKSLDI